MLESPNRGRAIKSCSRHGMAARACWVAMVAAEQDSFSRCFLRCRRMRAAGEPPREWWYCTPDNPVGGLVPFPFAGEEIERVHAAIALCCDGIWGLRVPFP